MPYKQIINKTYKQKENLWDEDIYQTCYYLRDIIREKRNGDNFIVLYDGYSAHIRFYINLLNEKGKNILLRKNEVQTGEIVLISQDEMRKFLEENYEYKTLETFYNLQLYEIVCEK
jgi:hypothetical protein